MKVRIFKLVTGEEVLGEFLSEDHDTILVLRNPVGVAIVPGQNGQPNIGFAPFPLHAEQQKDAKFDFQRSHVVYYYEPAEDFVNNYNQIFGSGIVLPSKKLITG